VIAPLHLSNNCKYIKHIFATNQRIEDALEAKLEQFSDILDLPIAGLAEG
jgi:hypothetical protein